MCSFPFSVVVSERIADLGFFCFSADAAFFNFQFAFFACCRDVVLFYPGMGCFGDRFTGGELLVAYAAVGVSGVACGAACCFFLVANLWFVTCGCDGMVFEIAACFACAAISSVGCTCRFFCYLNLPVVSRGFDWFDFGLVADRAGVLLFSGGCAGWRFCDLAGLPFVTA